MVACDKFFHFFNMLVTKRYNSCNFELIGVDIIKCHILIFLKYILFYDFVIKTEVPPIPLLYKL